jgi:hypothetical protein
VAIDRSARPADPRTLRLLRRILAVKIAGTIMLFCVPMLVLDQQWLGLLYGLRPEPLLMARLVGGAYAALIVGYAAGWLEARRGRYPGWVVAMGLVSNGGGAILALWAVATGDVRLDQLRPFGFAAILFAAAIAAGLGYALWLRGRAGGAAAEREEPSPGTSP